MGSDSETELKKCYMVLGDGARVELLGAFPSIEIEFNREPETVINRSFSGTLTMRIPGRLKRFLKVYCETTILIRRLAIIGQRTKKKRTKKKLLGRINRAIYKQIKAGL